MDSSLNKSNSLIKSIAFLFLVSLLLSQFLSLSQSKHIFNIWESVILFSPHPEDVSDDCVSKSHSTSQRLNDVPREDEVSSVLSQSILSSNYVEIGPETFLSVFLGEILNLIFRLQKRSSLLFQKLQLVIQNSTFNTSTLSIVGENVFNDLHNFFLSPFCF